MSWRKASIIALALLLLAALLAAMARFLPPGVDWEKAYRPASLALLSGKNPYEVFGFYNAPWTLLPILPLALLPVNLGRAAFFLMGLLGFSFTAYRLKARPLAWGAFLGSPPVMHCLLNASIDWMPLVGFVLPPRYGLFLVLIKPQVGFTVALFWLVEAWRDGGLRRVVWVFWPVTVVMLLSFALFGLWPFRFDRLVDLWWNASLWPMSIPVGLGLMAAAFRTRKINFAMGAAPCLSPYVLFHSWSGALAAILPLQAETVAAVAGLWILVILRALDLYA
jgi:hypothetical protein